LDDVITGEDSLKEDDVPATAAHLKPLPNPPDALESLFREHHQQIFRTAYRITGSPTDAEDVLQTVFLRLMRREESDGYDFAPSPAAYLVRASINASLDVIRSRRSHQSVNLQEIEAETIASLAASPEAQHEDRELRLLIRQAVATLGPKAAAVFALRYFEGYDNREIAEMLGTSQMVVAVVLHRSRLRLRKEISKYLEKQHETQK
jgi:RNA polymerase sigma-70 factor (ECF subfamily)